MSTHPIFYRHLPGRGLDFAAADERDELPLTEVGNDVWVGANVCVKAGVRIVNGVTIATRPNSRGVSNRASTTVAASCSTNFAACPATVTASPRTERPAKS